MPIYHDPQQPVPPLPQDQPVLQLNGLTFRYPDGHTALDGVSLNINWGEKVALVGANGAGKSTLMLNLVGLLKGEGEIQIAGMSLTKENLPRIRAKVGLVFQNPDDQLFSPTVFDDVAFGPLHMGLPETEVRQRVNEALAQVEMRGFADRSPYHLSMGQKKRVAIATVLSMRPDILVMDEPSAGLDPHARRQLIQLLQTLPLTMLVSTHDMIMVQELFPRVVMMAQGKSVADGETASLFADEPLLTSLSLK